MSQLALVGGLPAVRRPLAGFKGIGDEERSAVLRVLDEGTLSGFYGSPQPRFFGGPEVLALEDAWCRRFGVAHAVTVNSATSGLIAAMGAIGLGPGDEVIVPPYTMSATAVAPLFYGAVPVFADIEPNWFCIDPAAVARAITPFTRAIVAVNLFGHPAELTRLRALADAHGLFLIEDNAQAILAEEAGRFAGTVGHIGVYSLNVHKHIQTGEGGVCVTSDPGLARRLQLIRNHGENVTEWVGASDLTNLVGFNFRMPELAAAIGRAQLAKMDGLVSRCERLAALLSEGVRGLAGLTPPAVREGCRHNYFMWTLRYDAAAVGAPRSAFCRALQAEGVPVSEGYVRPLYLLPLFQQRKAIGPDGFPFTLRHRTYSSGLCPVVEAMHDDQVIQFQPVSWDVDDEQIDMIVEAFHKVHRAAPALDRNSAPERPVLRRPAPRVLYSKPAGDVLSESETLLSDNWRLLEEQRRVSAHLSTGARRSSCLLCGADIAAAPWFDHRAVVYVRCGHCSHVQTRNRLPPGYPEAQAPGLAFGDWYPSADRHAFDSRRDRIYQAKLDFVLTATDDLGIDRETLLGKRWLELGCGAGYFLDALSRAGVERLTGLDASAPLVNYANQMLSRPVSRHWSGSLPSALAAHEADVIVAWFVLEHVEEAQAFWRALGGCPPGTIFCFAVPTLGLSTLLETTVDHHYARNLDSMLHCQLYTEESISHALQVAGFDPVAHWVFGQDALDLRRMLSVPLMERASASFRAALAPALNAALDPLQNAIDRAHLADARHVIAVKR
ncbi:hypothetical protein C1S70_30275 (plasmid) [Azospirillum argentinense]|uniref:Methyltransferase domain-containing protein n=1 Tax=Azospirillum argentinense TaxID=2970906 RepID=A0A2K1FRL5_9PROT|nr:DegT/DnrJ/EryC1/StrS family aminotransferase [Azospirillum argentinense]PNQ95176.1 hypothetical protein C1S70_30275 [Azospirillum argentinense]